MTAVEGDRPPPARIVFVDTETTGLRDHHEPWEIGLIVRDYSAGLGDVEHLYYVEPAELERADPEALAIGRYYQRTKDLGPPAPDMSKGHANAAGLSIGDPWLRWSDPARTALPVARITAGAVLVGCNVQFDARMLSRFLRHHGQAPAWHYRPVDAGAMAYGYLYGRYAAAGLEGRPDAPALPWSSAELAAALGVTADPAVRHTAMGDARFARDLYDRITGADL